jgi:hypothetical protein
MKKNVVLGLAALATAPTSVAALDGPGRALVASDQVRLTVNDTLAGAPGATIARSFIPPYSGTVRLSWQIRSKDGTEVRARVSVEHVSQCDDATTSSTTFVTQTCDIRVAGGMPVTLAAMPFDGTNVVSLHGLQLRYTIMDSNGKAIPWELPEVTC